MAKKLADGRWQCEKCDYTNTKEGYVRNHEKLKHGDERQQTGQKTDKAPGKDGGIKCPDCKGTNCRLLNSSVPDEKQAKSKGLKYICDDCEEVWK